MIAGPIMTAGATLASTSGAIAGSTAARVGIMFGTEVIAGMAAGAGVRVLSNAYDGR